MRRFQRLGNLTGDVEGFIDRDRAGLQPFGEIRALDEFENERAPSVRLAERYHVAEQLARHRATDHRGRAQCTCRLVG